jgi:hypothetical protein
MRWRVPAIVRTVLGALGIGRGRPIDLHGELRAYERERKRAWRAAKKAVPDMSGTCPGHVPDTPHTPLKNLNIKKAGARIPEKWRPDDEGLRLANSVFGDAAEAEIEKHRAYWLGVPSPHAEKADWNAVWRRWCLSKRDEQLKLDLRPRGTQLGVVANKRVRLSAEDIAGAIGKVFIRPETHPKQWTAWTAHRGGRTLPVDRSGGWPVESEWPPGWRHEDQQAKEGHG